LHFFSQGNCLRLYFFLDCVLFHPCRHKRTSFAVMDVILIFIYCINYI
jgi:hypothetical protein